MSSAPASQVWQSRRQQLYAKVDVEVSNIPVGLCVEQRPAERGQSEREAYRISNHTYEAAGESEPGFEKVVPFSDVVYQVVDLSGDPIPPGKPKGVVTLRGLLVT